MNAFVDYGAGPIFTALVGTLKGLERIDTLFVLSDLFAGVLVFVAVGLHEFVSMWRARQTNAIHAQRRPPPSLADEGGLSGP